MTYFRGPYTISKSFITGHEESTAKSNINDIIAFDLTGGNGIVTLADRPDAISLMTTGYLIAINLS